MLEAVEGILARKPQTSPSDQPSSERADAGAPDSDPASIMFGHCDAMQKVYNRAHALKKAEHDNSDESDEDEGGDAEEVRMVYTPGGPYYECSDGSHVRVWNNPHMLAQLAAGGAYNWRRERERRRAREGAN